MKRKRVRLSDIPEEVYQAVLTNPLAILKLLRDVRVALPKGTSYILCSIQLSSPKAEIRTFFNLETFLNEYTALLMEENHEEMEFHALETEDGQWSIFLPPPIIGLGLHTKVRPSLSLL